MSQTTDHEPAGTGLEHEPPRCAACGDVIGMYELAIHVSPGITRETARAAEPGLFWGPDVRCYHRGCAPLTGRP